MSTISKTKVICISAKAFGGKDFTASVLKEKLESEGRKVLITHYADLLKYICKTFFDWNGEKDEKGRSILQYVGTEKVRGNDPDFWVNFIIKIITLFDGEWDYVIIPDTRFPNEADLMKEFFNTKVIRVNRINFTSTLTEEQKNHPSETAMDSYNFDIVLTNDGTDDFVRVVKELKV